MPAPSKPQIKINALLRLLKEYDAYNDEEETLSEKLTALEKEPSPDEYEVRKTQKVLEETKRVKSKVAKSIHEYATEVSKLGGLKSEEEAQAKQALDAAAKIN